MHSVVGFRRLAHLRQNVEVEITDDKLVGMVPLTPQFLDWQAAPQRFLHSYLSRFTAASLRRPNARAPRKCPESLERAQAVLEAPVLEVPATGAEASEFPSHLAVARRYGDQ